MNQLPIIALTCGDIAGIGPEVTVRAAGRGDVRERCLPVVVGHPDIIRRTVIKLGTNQQVRPINSVQQLRTLQSADNEIFCWNPPEAVAAPDADSLLDVPYGYVHRVAGWHAYTYLQAATRLALSGQIDGIVTAPLNKQAMRLAGLNYPGHTEVLAETCNVNDYAMMLYLPASDQIVSAGGLGVAHATLHTSVASVPGLLTTAGIVQKSKLLSQFLQAIGIKEPRIGISALNPHAGEVGLFGNEEEQVIQPAVLQAAGLGISVTGPFPADTLFLRAIAGEFDGIVAMYHDQGHIPFKLLGFHRAVNITLGLPIVRTSPSHGTAFDIAGKGIADESGMTAAINIARMLICKR